jgi:two-component system sensor histidine kinase PhcS
MEAYRDADDALRVRQAKLCSVLSMILVPACFGLDFFVYPDLVWKIFVGRIICDIVLLPCFLLLFTQWGRRHVHFLGNAPPLVPAFTICWMIYISEGVLSPYYAGLNIVMVGVILLIPYTLREAGLICAIVVFSYAGTCVTHRVMLSLHEHKATAPPGASSYINNIYFLSMTTVLALAACHYTSKRRFEEFRLRYELDVNNRELATTLTKLKETEVQLVQSEKMNALGKLSAGLLHEVNNPLNFTFMALQVAQQEAEGNESLTDTLKDIDEGMKRIRTVVSDLRAFAYPTDHLDLAEISLDETLTQALRLTAHELGTISIDREGIKDRRAMGASVQVVHVFMNLLVNSAHALKKVTDRTPQIKVYCIERDGRLDVCVRDNGTGVAPEHITKLLDPFFTTKQPGEGMGLGLSICHTIVKNHGGTMRINSEFGQWTEVSFDLPLTQASTKGTASQKGNTSVTVDTSVKADTARSAA